MFPRIRPERQDPAPRHPDWEAVVRASFARQGVMGLFGAELSDLAPGRCRIRLPFRPQLSQQHGYFHAGVTATVIDSAGGYAGLTLMPAGAEVLTVEFKLNLLAPADGEQLIAEGEVIRAGRRLVVTRGEAYVLRGGQAVHCASMQQTLMTMHGRA